MDTILKKYAILLLFVLLKSVVYAQPDYQTQMDNIFNIPANKVTTGVLINRSPDIIEMQNFKPQTNANNATAVNTINWLEIFYRLYASHLNMNSFSYDVTLADKYRGKKIDEQTIPLGLIYYHYDKIKHNAVQNGLLTVDTVNQTVNDISPWGQSPLEVDTCFAASALTDTVTTGTNVFLLKDSLFVSNKKSDIQEIYMDFDNGQGYVRIYPNQTIGVTYGSAGNKTLSTKILMGSKNYYASTGLYVKESQPQRVAQVNNIPIPDFRTYYDNNGILAWYGIWYRCNHNNTIRKPILVVSGFDPSDVIRISDEVPEGKPKAYLYNIANTGGFLDRLRELGYDIIIYRSANSTESIEKNAKNLVNFMQEKVINANATNNELIVLGASMGGLVCRYALTYMEHNGIPHKTKLFVSLDSPQNGANVPLGFQYMAYYLNKDLFGLVPMLDDAIETQLGCKAAKEMLLYHYEATQGNTAKCHSDRTEFLNSLASIGNFPQQCTTMAISLGSGIGATQGFSAGATLIKKNPSLLVTGSYITLDLLLFSLFGIPPTIGVTLDQVTWEFEVNAVPNQTSKSIYKENISLKICVPKTKIIHTFEMRLLGIPPIIQPYLDCSPDVFNRNIVVNNTMPLDNAPASIKNWHNLKDFDFGDLGQVFNTLGVTNIDQNPDCFIPAYSALGLNIAPHTNIKNYLNTQANIQRLSPTSANYHFYHNANKVVSPFDYLYIENTNNDHIYDDNKQGVFSANLIDAMDHLISPHQLLLENKTISTGKSVAYEAVNVTITNLTVESGGNLDITANSIVLEPGFHAKAGSNVLLKADNSWICPVGSMQSVSFSPLTNLDFGELDKAEFQDTLHEIEQLIHLPTLEETGNEIRFFPNPVENILNLQILNQVEGEIRITIIDVKGQVVYSQSIINNVNNTIDCSKLINGIYFVNVAFKDSMRTIKIIKK